MKGDNSPCSFNHDKTGFPADLECTFLKEKLIWNKYNKIFNNWQLSSKKNIKMMK